MAAISTRLRSAGSEARSEMSGIDEPIDELGGRRHRAVEGGGDLADGHLPARSQLEQHLDLSGRQAMGVTEIGDSQ